MATHAWPGLGQKVWIPDGIPVEVKLITHPRFRAFQKSTRHNRSTWHDTGNPRTNADAEWQWANNGRQGAGVGGYNAIFDDRKIIICQPFDEVVWGAGTTEGNATSYHAEQAWGTGVNWERCLEVGYAFHGGIIAARGWSTDTALVQHHFWYGKHCPGQIRNRGLWSQVVKGVANAAERARQATTPAPMYAKPAAIPELDAVVKAGGVAPFVLDGAGATWISVFDRVRTIRPTGRYQRANRGGERVGPDLRTGEEFDVDFITNYGDEWWGYTPWATRIAMVDVERISDVKGA